jgi:hypothetical protein
MVIFKDSFSILCIREMNHLIKDKQLPINFNLGKGAWTYSIIIPNTKDLKGKWGDLKVSGSIDNYNLECKNISPKKGYDNYYPLTVK